MGAHDSFEIFRKVRNSEPEWLETCTTLESAVERARKLALGQPGDYFVFDRQKLRFIDAAQDLPIGANTRVLVVDDHEAVREGVRRMLQRHGRVEVVGEASNGREAVERAHNLQPDLIIMDWGMPLLDGLTAAQLIRNFSPQTAILIFSVHTGRPLADLVRKLGLNGFVAKTDGRQALLAAIEAVMHEQRRFPG